MGYDRKCLLTASRGLADTGTYRAFLVLDVELPTDQARVDQENKIAQCLAMAGITHHRRQRDGILFDISRDHQHFICMVSQVNGDAEQNSKRVAEGLPHGMALPFGLP